ncbi:MAG: hypothetical protein RL199_416 [Pseudomonadota bacterium]|jgi:hypothetical protein
MDVTTEQRGAVLEAEACRAEAVALDLAARADTLLEREGLAGEQWLDAHVAGDTAGEFEGREAYEQAVKLKRTVRRRAAAARRLAWQARQRALSAAAERTSADDVEVDLVLHRPGDVDPALNAWVGRRRDSFGREFEVTFIGRPGRPTVRLEARGWEPLSYPVLKPIEPCRSRWRALTFGSAGGPVFCERVRVRLVPATACWGGVMAR